MLKLSVQYADASYDWQAEFPRPLLRRWVKSALQASTSEVQLTVRWVDCDEGQALNRTYRGKDYATNVLTFDYDAGESALDDLPEEVRLALQASGEWLGDEQHPAVHADIVLCGEVLRREAQAQGKTLVAHAAHLVVHGVLHAQGFDHLDDEQAAEMEQLEIEILHGLGFANPYTDV